jgi:[ribosomal protein S5]-alanine N-acetyltransferase
MTADYKLYQKFSFAPPYLETERIVLRMAHPAESEAVAQYFTRNKDHLARFGPERPEEFYTETYWNEQILTQANEFESDQGLGLFMFPKEEPGTVIGTINFFGIVRKVAHYCILGYGIDAASEGKGLMTEALEKAISYVFDEMLLHRIMANYMPDNERSGKLLRRLGFSVEGYARDYLYFHGQWRDHVLTSLTNDNWKQHG